MSQQVLPLYPTGQRPRPLRGLYLEHRLHEIGNAAAPFIYANFVSSLDGRIAVMDEGRSGEAVMAGLANPNDFRLLQELEAQADCLITHGGYLRSLEQGQFGNVLQITPSDLVEWRKDNGLQPQPAIVIASASLEFTVPPSVHDHGQPVYIATGREADPARVEALRQLGYPILIAGQGTWVEGAPLVRSLGELGYKCAYLTTGPKMLETMLRDRKLGRLYLTVRHRLLGGEHFHTMIDGPPIGGAGELRLRTLYQDDGVAPGDGQWFASFDCV
ncbi:MAG: riboflavin biosynthesis protein RibD [Proteobacteria bacterium]|nr:MAG: riboflavin biosynthesis protein RibD [Pseudomonadota bacterium]